jgi:two-component system, OmpR family, response regulator
MTIAPAVSHAHALPPTPARRILIVDDDPTAALITQRGLQFLLGSDVEVHVAPSASAAWMRCLREPIDLLLVDPAPHDRAAWALLKALQEQHPTITVLVLTAYDTVGLRMQMQKLGVRHYLAKPATLQELEQAVRVSLGLEVPFAEELSNDHTR